MRTRKASEKEDELTAEKAVDSLLVNNNNSASLRKSVSALRLTDFVTQKHSPHKKATSSTTTTYAAKKSSNTDEAAESVLHKFDEKLHAKQNVKKSRLLDRLEEETDDDDEEEENEVQVLGEVNTNSNVTSQPTLASPASPAVLETPRRKRTLLSKTMDQLNLSVKKLMSKERGSKSFSQDPVVKELFRDTELEADMDDLETSESSITPEGKRLPSSVPSSVASTPRNIEERKRRRDYKEKQAFKLVLRLLFLPLYSQMMRDPLQSFLSSNKEKRQSNSDSSPKADHPMIQITHVPTSATSSLISGALSLIKGYSPSSPNHGNASAAFQEPEVMVFKGNILEPFLIGQEVQKKDLLVDLIRVTLELFGEEYEELLEQYWSELGDQSQKHHVDIPIDVLSDRLMNVDNHLFFKPYQFESKEDYEKWKYDEQEQVADLLSRVLKQRPYQITQQVAMNVSGFYKVNFLFKLLHVFINADFASQQSSKRESMHLTYKLNRMHSKQIQQNYIYAETSSSLSELGSPLLASSFNSNVTYPMTMVITQSKAKRETCAKLPINVDEFYSIYNFKEFGFLLKLEYAAQKNPKPEDYDIIIQFYVKGSRTTKKIGFVKLNMLDYINKKSYSPHPRNWGRFYDNDLQNIYDVSNPTKVIGKVNLKSFVEFEYYPNMMLNSYQPSSVPLNFTPPREKRVSTLIGLSPSVKNAFSNVNAYEFFDILIEKMIRSLPTQVQAQALSESAEQEPMFNFEKSWILEEYSKVYGINENYKRLKILEEIVKQNRNDLLLSYSNNIQSWIHFIQSNKSVQYTVITKYEEKLFGVMIEILKERIYTILTNFLTLFPKNKPRNILAKFFDMYYQIQVTSESITKEEYDELMKKIVVEGVTNDYNSMRYQAIAEYYNHVQLDDFLTREEEQKNRVEQQQENVDEVNCKIIEKIVKKIQDKLLDLYHFSRLFTKVKLDFYVVCLEEYYGLFKKELENYVQQHPVLTQKKALNPKNFVAVSSVQVLEMCCQIEEFHHTIQNEYEKEELENITFVTLHKQLIERYKPQFFTDLEKKLALYCQEALKLDKFVKLKGALHSTSVIDLFTSFHQFLDYTLISINLETILSKQSILIQILTIFSKITSSYFDKIKTSALENWKSQAQFQNAAAQQPRDRKTVLQKQLQSFDVFIKQLFIKQQNTEDDFPDQSSSILNQFLVQFNNLEEAQEQLLHIFDSIYTSITQEGDKKSLEKYEQIRNAVFQKVNQDLEDIVDKIGYYFRDKIFQVFEKIVGCVKEAKGEQNEILDKYQDTTDEIYEQELLKETLIPILSVLSNELYVPLFKRVLEKLLVMCLQSMEDLLFPSFINAQHQQPAGKNSTSSLSAFDAVFAKMNLLNDAQVLVLKNMIQPLFNFFEGSGKGLDEATLKKKAKVLATFFKLFDTKTSQLIRWYNKQFQTSSEGKKKVPFVKEYHVLIILYSRVIYNNDSDAKQFLAQNGEKVKTLSNDAPQVAPQGEQKDLKVKSKCYDHKNKLKVLYVFNTHLMLENVAEAKAARKTLRKDNLVMIPFDKIEKIACNDGLIYKNITIQCTSLVSPRSMTTELLNGNTSLTTDKLAGAIFNLQFLKKRDKVLRALLPSLQQYKVTLDSYCQKILTNAEQRLSTSTATAATNNNNNNATTTTGGAAAANNNIKLALPPAAENSHNHSEATIEARLLKLYKLPSLKLLDRLKCSCPDRYSTEKKKKKYDGFVYLFSKCLIFDSFVNPNANFCIMYQNLFDVQKHGKHSIQVLCKTNQRFTLHRFANRKQALEVIKNIVRENS